LSRKSLSSFGAIIFGNILLCCFRWLGDATASPMLSKRIKEILSTAIQFLKIKEEFTAFKNEY
jgi:hypothetical protein